ncbi:MAG: hypothetical protein ACRCY8_18920 [Dermatophilaceae bacterium]
MRNRHSPDPRRDSSVDALMRAANPVDVSELPVPSTTDITTLTEEIIMSVVHTDTRDDVTELDEVSTRRRGRGRSITRRVVPAVAAAAIGVGGVVAWNVTQAPTASAAAFREATLEAATQAKGGVRWTTTLDYRTVTADGQPGPGDVSIAMSGSWDGQDMSISRRTSVDLPDSDDDDPATIFVEAGRTGYLSLNGEPWEGPFTASDLEMERDPFRDADPAVGLADLAAAGGVTPSGTATLPDGASADRYLVSDIASRDDLPGLLVALGVGVVFDDEVASAFGPNPTTEVLVDETGQVRQVRLSHTPAADGQQETGVQQVSATVDFTQYGEVGDLTAPEPGSPGAPVN